MAERYKFGDYLVPMATDLMTALPQLQRQGQQHLLDQAKLALDNRKEERFAEEAAEDREYRDKTFRQNVELQRQQQKFRDDQAKRTEMNNMLRLAKTPAQQAMIYNKYGMPDMATEVEKQGEIEEGHKDSLRSFYSKAENHDIMTTGAAILQTLDPTKPEYTRVYERVDKAVEDEKSNLPELLADPYYGALYNAKIAQLKLPNANIVTIGADIKRIQAQFLKSQGGGTGGGDDDTGGAGGDEEEQDSDYAADLLNEEVFEPEGALSFLPEAERKKAKKAVAPLEEQYDVLTAQLSTLVSQRKAKYDDYEAKKKELKKKGKQLRYYAKIKDKAKLKEISDSHRNLASEVNALYKEVDHLKTLEMGFGATTAAMHRGEQSLGAQIARTQQEILKLQRQSKRLSGQPVYSS